MANTDDLTRRSSNHFRIPDPPPGLRQDTDSTSGYIEPGQMKPKNEGINNTDVPGVPKSKRALNNPTGQDEGLSGGGADPLADL